MFNKVSRPFVQSLIQHHTKIWGKHLTPELRLHLITPECPLWLGNPNGCPFDDPFWAFYWPGGQALTRFVFDNPKLFSQKRILDIGSGCGSAALASKMVGAKTVVANDIDPVALIAIEMNMEINLTTVLLNDQNLLTEPLNQQFDFIIFGDMFYDPDFTDMISEWLRPIDIETNVLIGDPGRLSFTNHPLHNRVELLKEYELPETCILENNGFAHGAVWKLIRELR